MLVTAAALGGLAVMSPGAQAAPRHPARARPARFADEGQFVGDAHAAEHAQAAVESLSPSIPAASLAVRSTKPQVIGQWSAPFTPPGAVTAIHMVLLRTGKVLEWSMHGVKKPGETYAELQAM